MMASLVAQGVRLLVVVVAMQVLLCCSNVWRLMMNGSRFPLAGGLQVAAVAMVA